MKKTITFLLLVALQLSVNAQDLDSILNSISEPEIVKTEAIFKATRIISNQSVETMGKGDLLFIIMHRFGALNSGIEEFFGLDESVIRFGFEYGVTPRLTLGIGRGNNEKIYDGFFKYRVLQQSDKMPLSLAVFSGVSYASVYNLQTDLPFKNEWYYYANYYTQLLIARKINSRISLQLAPTLMHRNITETALDPNTQYACGIGGRYKLNKRLTLNAEYTYIFNPMESFETYSPISLGLDIETGGHVFHLAISNAIGLNESQFIGKTTGNVVKGDIFLGFNINRTF
ncbi:MAG TPA: hypothetical protein DCQ31_06240 [Bacteroidales bacterium]|nr:hypothetical protein [Bacteroidales bacterium]